MVTSRPPHINGAKLRHFLSCDWGTSSFRLRLVEIKSVEVVAGISNNKGIKKVYEQWSATSAPQDRIAYYCSFLKQQIEDLQKKISDLPGKSNQSIDGLFIVISGMASSSIGMQELPYGRLPFSLEHPNVKSEFFEADEQFPHDMHLISGLKSARDVMRGEETELIGLFETKRISDGLYILAGTHSKHVFVEDEKVTDFKTYMTGELFDLLAFKSILSDSVAIPKDGPGDVFEKGVRSSLNSNILHEFFTIRARDILDKSDPADSYDYLSGLLIGTELKNIRQRKGQDEIVLSGNPQLQKYYAAALHMLDLCFSRIDSSATENIIPTGHLKILNQRRSC
jgi:2-dehydro-3-deoxygalactonokinase